jgi:ubiquinone/menaquinone biosynthesis C-methylase UbiE
VRVCPIEGHRIWSSSYDSDMNPVLALDKRVLSERLGCLQGLRVVDVGCGTGRWMTFAQSQGAEVVGIDLCREMLIAAARKPALAGRLALARATQLPLAQEVADLTLCSLALSYFPSAAAAIAEIARITRPGGRVVVSDLHPRTARAGWKRSFRSADQVYVIEHRSYPGRLVKIVAERYGLTLDWEVSACFGAPEREIFVRAGKESVFLEASSGPALHILTWVKR